MSTATIQCIHILHFYVCIAHAYAVQYMPAVALCQPPQCTDNWYMLQYSACNHSPNTFQPVKSVNLHDALQLLLPPARTSCKHHAVQHGLIPWLLKLEGSLMGLRMVNFRSPE